MYQSESSDNSSSISGSIPSQEEQAKIMAQINKEESINLNQIVRKEDDAIYIEDTPAKALQKLLTLSESSSKEKLVYTKHLGELMTILGNDGVQNLSSILKIMLSDSDEIKKALITQLPQICELLQKRPQGYAEIKEHVIGALQTLLQCPNIDIKEEAGKEIIRIAPYLSEDDRGILILTKVINMAHDEVIEENKIVAVQLFGKLSSIFGQSLTESFVAFEILSMGEDVKQRVRKEAVLQLANVGSVVTFNFFKSRLLPFFYKYYHEYILQENARRELGKLVSHVWKICNMQLRESEITQRMLTFLSDQSKWVKAAAYKNLGPFIETLSGSSNLNDKLFEHYLKMTDSEVRDLGIDKEILQVCSFNFPAVLQTFGPGKWPQMQKLFQQLFKNSDKRVKKPLACSLHEIALILGPQRSEKELISVLEQILKDTNEDIKYGTIQNLWKFLKVFETERRESLLDVFLILQKDQKKWRIRELIARQIHELTKIYSAETVFQIIVPISLKLCNDVVSSVRKQAAKRIYGLIEALSGPGLQNEGYRLCVVENIKGFAVSNRFNQRQAFVTMCENLMNLEGCDFETNFLNEFEELSRDKVKNVRMLVAKVLQKHLKKNGRLSDNLRIQQIVANFEKDEYISKCLNYKFENSSPTKLIKNEQVDIQTPKPNEVPETIKEVHNSSPQEEQVTPQGDVDQPEHLVQDNKVINKQEIEEIKDQQNEQSMKEQHDKVEEQKIQDLEYDKIEIQKFDQVLEIKQTSNQANEITLIQEQVQVQIIVQKNDEIVTQEELKEETQTDQEVPNKE